MVEQGYRERLAASPMTPFQITAIALVAALCTLDGFDLFAITFIVPVLEQDWGVNKAQLGVVISVGLLGMALGSLFLAPLADLWGRRRMLLVNVSVVTTGTALSAISNDITMLGLSRLVTGMGIGGMVSVINPLAGEYANARRRDFCVAIVALGIPMGGIIGGVLAAWLLPSFGWRSLFICATGLGLGLLALTWLFLLEPVESLLSRPGEGTLEKANAFLRRCRQPALDTLPAGTARPGMRQVLARLFSREMLPRTAQTVAIYFLYVISLYYMQSWIPAMVVDAGFNVSQAATVSVFHSIGGIAGGFAMGLATIRFDIRRCIATAFVTGAGLMTIFGFVHTQLALFVLVSALLGFFMVGGMGCLYAVVSRSFPAEIGASGAGLVMGTSRIGSAIAPALAGFLFATGLDRSIVSILMAVPAIIAALLVIRLKLARG
ncbi:MAG: MFS transporter [Blastomonas sp.]